MIEKFGVADFRAGQAGLLDYAEHQAREILRSVPDGEYVFSDYADEDSVNGNPCRLALTLKIEGDSAILDFTGTDPQLTSALNVPTGGAPRHTLLLVGVYYVLYTLNPQLLLNSGLTRPFTCITPEGTVLNPIFPAAVGMRSLTCARLRSLIFGAFSLAIPERMPAAPAGTSSIMNVRTVDNRTRQTILAAINPIVPTAPAQMAPTSRTRRSRSPRPKCRSRFCATGCCRIRAAPGTGAAGWRRPSTSGCSRPTPTSPRATATARGSGRGARWAVMPASLPTLSSIPGPRANASWAMRTSC
jgi:hypothetical protein